MEVASFTQPLKIGQSKSGGQQMEPYAALYNVLALNTDYVTAGFEPSKAQIVHEDQTKNENEQKLEALKRYENVLKNIGDELMVSGSDDFKLMLWNPSKEKKPLASMTGHQQLVNDVKFSPDARLIASASFDKSVRLWNGKTGQFLARLLGHVQEVYQLAWSADSRILVSCSADSTLKLWSSNKNKGCWTLYKEGDLPGHGDEVYTVDWSPDGQRVVSGGKYKVLRIWRK